jgi:hypothetical protein
VITDDNERGHAVTTGRVSTAAEEFAAAKYVTRRAVSDEDAAELLQMLGLVDPPWEWVGGRSDARRRVER